MGCESHAAHSTSLRAARQAVGYTPALPGLCVMSGCVAQRSGVATSPNSEWARCHVASMCVRAHIGTEPLCAADQSSHSNRASAAWQVPNSCSRSCVQLAMACANDRLLCSGQSGLSSHCWANSSPARAKVSVCSVSARLPGLCHYRLAWHSSCTSSMTPTMLFGSGVATRKPPFLSRAQRDTSRSHCSHSHALGGGVSSPRWWQ